MSLSQRANSIGSWLSLHSRRLLWPVWMVLIACWPHPALLIPLPWLFTLSSPVSLLRVVGFGGVFGVWYGLWSADWIRTCYCDSAWEVGPLGNVWLFCGLTCGAAVACGSLLAHFANRYGAPLWLSAGVGWCLAERLLQSIADSAGTSADPLRLAIVGSLPLNWLSAAVVRWGGCATASWAVAGCGGLALDIWKRPTATAGIPGVVVMALVSGLTDWGQAEPHDVPTTRIAVMPVVSLEILRNATAALKTSQAELLVLPELSIPDWDRGHPLWTEIQRVSAETGVPICFATLRYDRGQSELRNSVALVDPRSGIHFVYDKRWPSPIGERQTSWGGMTLLPGSGGAEINVSAGAAPRESYRLPDGARVGFGVCHDACFDGWVREYRRLSTPPVLLVLCSSEKFDRQGSSRRVFEMILRMRAIQAEMSIVRCSGGGSSGCVLSSGRWSQPAARSAHFTVFKTHLNR